MRGLLTGITTDPRPEPPAAAPTRDTGRRSSGTSSSEDQDSTTSLDAPNYELNQPDGFDFRAARARATNILQAARANPAYIPSEDELSEAVLKDYHRFLRKQDEAERHKRRKRDRSPDIISCIQSNDVNANGLAIGSASVFHVALAHSDFDSRSKAFEKAFEEVYAKVVTVKTGNSPDHSITRFNGLNIRCLKSHGLLLLQGAHSPKTDMDWCGKAREWQYHFMAQMLAIRHNVPALSTIV